MSDFAPYIGFGLSPFFALFVIAFIAKPFEKWLFWKMRDSRLRRILFYQW